MKVSVVLAALIAVIFTVLGAAKILAVPPMQARAALIAALLGTAR
jgi:hypothetical protein